MGYDFNPSLWFVCRLCRRSFASTETFKEHKLECHLGECPQIKCIVFEEKLVNEEWIPGQDWCENQSQILNGKPENRISLEERENTVELDYGSTRESLFQNPYVSLTRLTEGEIKSSFDGNEPGIEPQKIILGQSSSSESKADDNESELSEQELGPTNQIHVNNEKTTILDLDPLTSNEDNVIESSQNSIPFKIASSIFEEPTPANSFVNESEDFFQDIFEDVEEPEFIVGIVSEDSDEVARSQFPCVSEENQQCEIISYADSSITATAVEDPVQEEILPDNANGTSDLNSISTNLEIKIDTYDSDLLETCETVQNQEQEQEQETEEPDGSNQPQHVHLPINRKSSSETAKKNRNKNKKSFMCEICFSFLSTKQALQLHMLIHSSARPFKCPNCPMTFKRKDDLAGHQIVHGMETKFKCRFCDRCFIKNSVLANHERTHTGDKSFKCPVPTCDYAAYTPNVLAKHTRSKHCEELGLQQFLCPTCGKAFGIKSKLEEHLHVHSNVTPFHCNHPGCTKKFKLKAYLKSHLRTHRKKHLRMGIVQE